MTVSLTHSTPADGTFSATGATAWDAQHVLTQDTARLLGRTTAGVGATEEISVGAGLTLSGGTLINAGATSPIGGSNTQVQFNDGGVFAGNANFTFNKTTNQIAIAAGSAAAPTLIPTGDPNTGMWFPAADMIAWSTGGTERLRVDSAGNVGIGTTVLTNKLNLYTNSAVSVGVNAGNNQATWEFGVNASGLFTFYSNAAKAIVFSNSGLERFRISAAGEFGIGTSFPTTLLSVNGIASFGAGAAATPSIAAFGDLDTGMWFPAANTLAWSTGGSERMRITSDGNLGLGTSTFGTSAATVFSIATGTAPTTGPADTIQIYSTDLSAGNTMLSLYTEGTVVNANVVAATTHRIAIRVNGTVYYLLANTAA